MTLYHSACRPAMRIAYVTETYPPELNGVALTAARTVEHLRRRGHAVGLVRSRQSADDQPQRPDDCLTFGCPIPMYPDLRFGLSFAMTLQQRWQRAGTQLVHVATPGPLGWAAVSAAQRLALPVTSDFRTNFHQYAQYYGAAWMAPLVQAYLRRFHARAWRNFVPTQETLHELSAAGFERLHVVGRGVDTRCFAPAWRCPELRRQWAPAGGPVLLYVGRLAAEKNVALALRAFRAVRGMLPAARMIVVGDGPTRAVLTREYPEAHFVGVQRGETLSRHYASADMFLFPSLSDTFGNVTLEALASGLPVVAYDTAAAAEHVRDELSGRLVAKGDEAGFLSAVCALACRHERLSWMRAQARAAALRADWASVLGAFEDQLAQAVDAQQTESAQAALVA